MRIKSKKFLVYVLIIAIALTVPLWLTNDYFQTVVIYALINTVIVLGMNFVTGLIGQMNLGMAGMYGLGAYTFAILNVKLGLDPWICLLGAIGMGLLIGIALGWPSLRIKGIYLALTTLGFGEIVRLLITNLTSLTGGSQGLGGFASYHIGGYVINGTVANYFFVLAVAAICIIIAARITKSKWGRVFIAIRDNDEAIESSCIDIASAKIKAFILSSVFACVAGTLYASFVRYLVPTSYTQDLSAKYLMMLMLGGIGSVPGVIIGSFTVTVLPEVFRFMDNYYLLVFAAITLVFALILPNGLVSLPARIAGKFKKTSDSREQAE